MNTVIVGIDLPPGRKEPLSPLRPVGRRLAKAIGVPSLEYRRCFDRVNLFPYTRDGISPEKAAENLIPLLKGRRVLALGRIVQQALGIPRNFQWKITSHGFVGASVPHPSTINPWWMDGKNLEIVSEFLSSLRLPCVQVEGVDGSGKSTLVEKIAK